MNVQALRSSLTDQLSTRFGRVTLSAPVTVRVSTTGKVRLANLNQLSACGDLISATRWPIRTTPPVVAAAACAASPNGSPTIA